MASRPLFAALALFGGALAVSWLTHGTGTVVNDPARQISVPTQRTVPLQVQAAYNGSDVLFRYRWASPDAGIYHDMLRFNGSTWEVKGNAVPGSQPDGLHEDRIAMMLDDGSIPEFGRYGGYIAIGAGSAGFSAEASGKEVASHPYLGKVLKQTEVSKYLPATRTQLNDWAATRPAEEQAKLQASGYFLDLWHWRAARSSPVGYSDDQVITAARLSDSGKGSFTTNWDSAKKQPRVMFDPTKTGIKALDWTQVHGKKIAQESVHALREDLAIPFDPAAGWKDGDTLPRRILRLPDGSRADIAVTGEARWKDGFWDVTLRRKMDTGRPLEDKIIRDGGVYQAAFAIHRAATGGRWHYVSLPISVGFGRDADLTAVAFTGDTPDWTQAPKAITLFYPGQVNWPHLNSTAHGGASQIRKGVPVQARHSEEQLAHYGIEREFAAEIRWQWLLTLLGGVALIGAFTLALMSHLRFREA